MNLPGLILRNVRQNLSASLVTVTGLALAVGLLLTVWVVRAEAERTFTDSTGPFDAVLGARSAPLQLVLNALFHLEDWPGTIPMEDWEDIREHPAVQHAIPVAGGDNYRGFRIVGTTTTLFEEVEIRPGQPFSLQGEGRLFQEDRQEAVVGSFAAAQLGLSLGDIFHPYHGVVFDEAQRHAEEYVVVGILEPTNTPFDRALWIPLAGIQQMSGHDPARATRISAVLIQFHEESAAAGHRLNIMYNRQGDRLTLAWPVSLVISRFLDRFDWVLHLLTYLAWLITIVAIGTILVALYHGMNSRRKELAVFRALGARRTTLVGMVAGEGFFLSLAGILVGYLFHYGLLLLTIQALQRETGVVLQGHGWQLGLWWIPSLVLLLGTLAGALPGLRAYRYPTSRLLQEKGL